jgi:hypothetical protein
LVAPAVALCRYPLVFRKRHIWLPFRGAFSRKACQTMTDNAGNGVSGIVSQAAPTVSSIQEHIPRYLTLALKVALVQALSRFPADSEYYLVGKFQDELLQGDGWTKMQVLRFETGEKKDVLGLILSNTCDVAPENKRELPTNIVFAPVIKLASYVNLLKKAGLEENKLKNKIASIKGQEVTTIFYLPDAIGGLGEEHIVLLDDVHTMPSSVFQSSTAKTKAFTLSNLGFYMFIFKLSIHFCRLREDIARA